MISIFLPIRKGSKRVKNKNIKKFNKYKLGLSELKILQLKRLREKVIRKKIFKHDFEFIVSTDILSVIDFCKKFHWIKIHKRNLRDSTDNSLQRLINLIPSICNGNYILWTHVTSPFFSSSAYINFLKMYFRYSKINRSKSGFSAEIIGKFVYSKKKKWLSHNEKALKWPRTQDLDPLYIMNSAAIIAEKNIYLNQKNRLCKKPLPITVNSKCGLDIDNNEDFEALKKVKNFLI